MAKAEALEEIAELDAALEEVGVELSEEVSIVSKEIGTEVSDLTFNISEEIRDITLEASDGEMLNLLSNDELVNLLDQMGDETTSTMASEGLDRASISESLSSSSAEEQAVRNPAAGGGGRLSTLARVGNGLLIAGNIYVMIDFFGKQIYGLYQVIKDASKNPDWKNQMTDDDRKTLNAVQAALTIMGTITQSWSAQWEKLQEDPVGLGMLPVKIGGKTCQVAVIDIVYFTLKDMQAVSSVLM